jgi:hypothetical protein
MKTLMVSRCSSSKRLRHQAMPSPPNKADERVGGSRGSRGLRRLPHPQGRGQPHHEQRQVTLHHDRLRAFGDVQPMPGRRALVDHPMLTPTAPVRGLDKRERIVDLSLGERNRPPRFGSTILPPAFHHRMDGLADVIVAVGVQRRRGVPSAVRAGQCGDVHDARSSPAPPLARLGPIPGRPGSRPCGMCHRSHTSRLFEGHATPRRHPDLLGLP